MITIYLDHGVNPDKIEISIENNEYVATIHQYSGWKESFIRTIKGKNLDDVYKYHPGCWILAMNNPATKQEVIRCLNAKY